MSSAIPPTRRLREWLAPERADLWVIVIYSAAIGLLTLVVPVATQAMVNTIAFGMVLQPLVVLTLLVFVLLGFSATLRALRSWVVEVIQRRVFVRAAAGSAQRLLSVRIDAFDSGHGPELVNRFLEVVTVQKAGSILLVDGLAILTQTVVGFILLAVYHPILLAFGVVLLTCIAIIVFPMSSGAVSTAIEESRAKYGMVAWLEEIARFPATFKSMAGASYALSRTNDLAEDYLRHRAQHFRIVFRQIVGSLSLEAFAAAVLLAAGGWLVMQRQLTLGQLVAAELIVAVVVGGFAKFGKQLETYYDLLAAIDKLGYLSDLPAEPSGPEKIVGEGPAELRLRSVRFFHRPDKPLFEDLDCVIPAGARVALTGRSGDGKSTLLDILAGLRAPVSGVVEIDGQEYRSLDAPMLREHVALIRQAEIFQGTITDNLRLGNTDIPQTALRAAVERVGLLDGILALPQGFDSELSTGGQPLSAGQSLRLMLARALVHKPRVLLIDEVLDSVMEAESGAALCTHLLAPSRPYTVVLATKNPELLRQCDRVFVIPSGRLQEVAP